MLVHPWVKLSLSLESKKPLAGIREVGKGSWKERKVEKSEVGKSEIGMSEVRKSELGKFLFKLDRAYQN